MPAYVVRVWVPDEPGALGAVASRIGGVSGDLIGIDILERGPKQAIDELVVDLPDAALVPLLVAELSRVEGVAVEDVRPAADALRDPRLDALETAAVLVEQVDVQDLLAELVARAHGDFEADWAVVVDLDGPARLAEMGTPPPPAWLGAFVAGSRSSVRVAAGECGPDDTAWASMAAADLSVVLGRKGRPFRARERRQLAALVRIADHRWSELVERTARVAHPAGVR